MTGARDAGGVGLNGSELRLPTFCSKCTQFAAPQGPRPTTIHLNQIAHDKIWRSWSRRMVKSWTAVLRKSGFGPHLLGLLLLFLSDALYLEL